MTTAFAGHLLTGDHASRPAFGAVPEGTLYSCTDHALIYQSDGVAAWSTYATLGGPTATRASLGLDTTDSPQFAGLNVGAATDTTITRVSAGKIAVEGTTLLTDTDTITYLDLTTAAAPANPAAGKIRVYSKTGDTLAQKTSGGTETVFGAGGGGGGNISGQVGGAAINIPILQGDFDKIPASPNANDREFDSSTLGGTAVGTATTENANTRASIYYVNRTGTGGIEMAGRCWAWTPSNGDHVTARQLNLGALGTTTRSGLFVGVATPGAMDSVGFGASGTIGYFHDNWTSPTAYSGTPGSVSFGTHTPWSIPTFFRIVFNNSTSIDTQWSWNGRDWTTIVAARNPGYTVGSFGLMVEPTAAIDAYSEWDWVRVNWTP